MYYFGYKDGCQWGEWSINDCSVTCGLGTRTKTRTKKVSALYRGEQCDGPSAIEENCNTHECPGIIFCVNVIRPFQVKYNTEAFYNECIIYYYIL